MVEQIDRRRRQRLVLRNEVMKQPFFAAGVDEQGNTLDFIRLHSVVELGVRPGVREKAIGCFEADARGSLHGFRSEEHTSELQSLMRISYAVFCLKKKNNQSHTMTNIVC